MGEILKLERGDVFETELGRSLLALNNAHAQELSWLFTAHLVDDDFHMDS